LEKIIEVTPVVKMAVAKNVLRRHPGKKLLVNSMTQQPLIVHLVLMM
jgi:hypothetical protein